MEKEHKTGDFAPTDQKASVGSRRETPRPRTMSLRRAKKLIAKTSAKHDGLFGHLAK